MGKCKITKVTLIDEYGQEVKFDKYKNVAQEWKDRLKFWENTQNPVDFVRYPLAVSENKNKIQRGGMVWFQKFSLNATTGKNDLKVYNKLQSNTQNSVSTSSKPERIPRQRLPIAEDGRPLDPKDEILWGYDVIIYKDSNNEIGDKTKTIEEFEYYKR